MRSLTTSNGRSHLFPGVSDNGDLEWQPHPRPHFRIYQRNDAVIAVQSAAFLAAWALPARARRLCVEARLRMAQLEALCVKLCEGGTDAKV